MFPLTKRGSREPTVVQLEHRRKPGSSAQTATSPEEGSKPQTIEATSMAGNMENGKYLSLELNAVSVLLNLLSEEDGEDQRKTLVIYCLRALTALAEAPEGRCLLQDHLPLLEKRSQDQDQDIRRVARTAIRVVTWTP
ncbi:hypothetical protein CHARACLAT_032386 [Characodon lateralis]|uniref:Rhabdoid tumor deletion region protein 1 n=1 Tax=Characodon lateralis TaxID=208331 RepID=A0ABU7DW04_9TELE|nr:hypothetical protein [Characodon lateralis]